MTDFVTHLGFHLLCTDEEAERLVDAFTMTGETAAPPAAIAAAFPSMNPDDPFAGVAAFYDGADVFQIGARIERLADGVAISAEGEPQVIAIAEFIRALAPSVLPTGFTWADTGFDWDGHSHGGGYAVITGGGCEFHSAAALLEEALEAARG